MAPKIKVSKEKILDTAYKIVKRSENHRFFTKFLLF